MVKSDKNTKGSSGKSNPGKDTTTADDEKELEGIKQKGVIKQGTIAEFMRKRTQLVGFDIGFHKHTQYMAEFVDNGTIKRGHLLVLVAFGAGFTWGSVVLRY